MRAALRALLEHSIDYAGTFPPAKLPLEESSKNYAALVQGQESWIVNRHVCPTSRLSELSEILETMPKGASMPLTVIGTAAADLAALRKALDSDAAAMLAFDKALGVRARIEAYEVKVPQGEVRAALGALKAFRNVETFAEIPLDDSVSESVVEIAEEGNFGVKARTGGPDKKSFPESSILASFLSQTLDLELPLKLTAGLHEPIRHYDEKVGAWHHGFLNVFVAAVLHDAHALSIKEMQAVIDDANPDAFAFSDTDLAWNGLTASIDQIQETRGLLKGFGSCSVGEPLDGLRRLGLLEEVNA